ncbi:hypothetical protein TNCV_1334261 [Trichonephila clavipes]|nr:hypothetical protein TNCV_1334261 [Trichonephila clavipes]
MTLYERKHISANLARATLGKSGSPTWRVILNVGIVVRNGGERQTNPRMNGHEKEKACKRKCRERKRSTSEQLDSLNQNKSQVSVSIQ